MQSPSLYTRLTKIPIFLSIYPYSEYLTVFSEYSEIFRISGNTDRNVNLSAHRLLLLSVISPTIEYGSEVWEGNKGQAGSLESILDGAKRILGCSSKTCNEAVRGDMGLDTLQSRRDRAK